MAVPRAHLEVWVLFGLTADAAFLPVAVPDFPVYRHGRVGLVAVAGDATRLSTMHVRGSDRLAEILAAARAAAGNGTALHQICTRQFPRECLCSGAHERWHEDAEVCARGTAGWTATLGWLEEVSGRPRRDLLKYMQRVCSFAAARGLHTALLATRPVPWPTFPPGVANPRREPDALLVIAPDHI